jgi:hypothetical protein
MWLQDHWLFEKVSNVFIFWTTWIELWQCASLCLFVSGNKHQKSHLKFLLHSFPSISLEVTRRRFCSSVWCGERIHSVGTR